MEKTDYVGARVPPAITHNLDSVASQYGISRSTLIRVLLENCGHLYGILETEKRKQQNHRANIREKVFKEMENKLPEDLTPVMAEMVGALMKEVMEQVARTLSEKGGENSEK